LDGDGLGDVCDDDDDGDGIADSIDNCPLISNPTQADINLNGKGNACDDTDGDGIMDDKDNCPLFSNSEQSDQDEDGYGDICDNCPSTPNGPLRGSCGQTGTNCNYDAMCGIQGECITSQIDSDGDGQGDACDTDDDNDGIPDLTDNCWLHFNPGQEDSDGDGIGDSCNNDLDKDGDEWVDKLDNCPDKPNGDQKDANNNGMGDACEYDLKCIHVEVTQAIQDINNSVPLVFGKETWIRLYFDVGAAQKPLGPISGMIKFEYENGFPMYIEESGRLRTAPLHSENMIEAQPKDLDSLSLNINHTLNFRIPQTWIWGSSNVYCNIIVFYDGPDINTSNNSPAPRFNMKLYWTELSINIVPFYSCENVYIDGISMCPPSPMLSDRIVSDWLRQIYPVSKINMTRSKKNFISYDPTYHFLNGAALWDKLWWINLFTDDKYDHMKYFGLVCNELDPCSNLLSCKKLTGMGFGNQAWAPKHGHDSMFSITRGGESMAHEIGHTLLPNFHLPGQAHGEFYEQWPAHVPDECPNHNPPFFEDYPNPLGKIDENGFDGVNIYDKNKTYDIMSYAPCSSNSNDKVWVSTYIYKKIFNYLYKISKSAVTKSTYVNSECFVITGLIHNNNQIDSVKCKHLTLSYDEYDMVDTGSYSIELFDMSNMSLFTRFFNTKYGVIEEAETEVNTSIFSEILPYFPNLGRIEIKYKGSLIKVIEVSRNIPTIRLTYPNGGEELKNNVNITWTAIDADNDILTYDVLYSTDNGNTWQAIDVGLKQNSYVWNVNESAGSECGLIKVLVTDGVNTAYDISDNCFKIEEKLPEVFIFKPKNNASFFKNRIIVFEGHGFDLEDGPLPDSVFSWVSDIDGFLANGYNISMDSLSPGEHIVILTAYDSDGNICKDSITFTVNNVLDTDGDGIGDDVDENPFIADSRTSDDQDKCILLPDYDINNIIINGNFGNCTLTPWFTSINSLVGASATTSLVNGVCYMSDFVISDDPYNWHIQLMQPFTAEQLAKLIPGSDYTLSFEAYSLTKARPCNVYFGLNNDPWTDLVNQLIDISDEPETYSFDFYYPSAFSSLALSFGLGSDTASVIFDNIKLKRKVFDKDNDGIEDLYDNCADIANTDQADADQDGIGDACESNQTAVENITAKNSILVFPNPTSDFIKISTDNPAAITLFNILGIPVKMYTTPTTDIRIPVHDLPDGLYILEINTAHNRSIQRIIVQHQKANR